MGICLVLFLVQVTLLVEFWLSSYLTFSDQTILADNASNSKNFVSWAAPSLSHELKLDDIFLIVICEKYYGD